MIINKKSLKSNFTTIASLVLLPVLFSNAQPSTPYPGGSQPTVASGQAEALITPTDTPGGSPIVEYTPSDKPLIPPSGAPKGSSELAGINESKTISGKAITLTITTLLVLLFLVLVIFIRRRAIKI